MRPQPALAPYLTIAFLTLSLKTSIALNPIELVTRISSTVICARIWESTSSPESDESQSHDGFRDFLLPPDAGIDKAEGTCSKALFGLPRIKWFFKSLVHCLDASDFGTLLGESPFQRLSPKRDSEKPAATQYVILDYYDTNQFYLEYSLSGYTAKRNYFHDPPFYAPVYAIAELHARAYNATLVAKDYAEYNNILQAQYSTILPAVLAFDSSQRNLKTVWHRFKLTSCFGTVHLIRKPSIAFNFAYCDIPRKLHASDFGIFIYPFRNSVWGYIGAAFVSVGGILGLGFINRGRSQSVVQQFVAALFYALSALISSGPASFGHRVTKSKLFCLWAVSCVILVNYYSGQITSLLISPPPDDVMKSMTDLLKRNYTLIFEDRHKLSILKSSVSQYTKNGSTARGEKLDDIVSIKRLLGSLAEDPIYPFGFVELLAFGERTATIVFWMFALRAATRANEAIRSMTKSKFQNHHRRCHVGKRLVEAGEAFTGFLLPSENKLYQISLRLEVAGLNQFWINEMNEMSYSKRVQDRCRVKSSIAIKHERLTMSQISALKLEGNIVTIFLLWTISTAFCICGFTLESITYRIIGETVVTSHPSVEVF